MATIEYKLAEKLDKLEAVIDVKFDTLKSSVDDLKVKQDHAFSRISQVERMANQCDNNLNELKQLLSDKDGELSTLKIELEDLRNHQTRKTLNFYGFPEGVMSLGMITKNWLKIISLNVAYIRLLSIEHIGFIPRITPKTKAKANLQVDQL